MFVILDTNHLRELVHESVPGNRLRQRLIDADTDPFTTVVTVQEIFQGWSAEINRRAAGRAQVSAYGLFLVTLKAVERFTVLPFDDQAAEEFHRIRTLHRQAGTMDLKIAAIALSYDATLLTRNLSDFQGIAGLRAENWMD